MGKLVVKEEDTQTTPPTGYVKMYPKTDGKWHYKADDGVEWTKTTFVPSGDRSACRANP